jgi:hypothetical protein
MVVNEITCSTSPRLNNYTFPMEPNRFGRKLGIGVRVASRMVKERATQAANTPSSATQPPPQTNAAPSSASANASRPSSPPRTPRNYVEPARRVGEGTRRFGQAFFEPLTHVGRTLWLEITGLFFALFGFFFAQNAYRNRASALHGPAHAQFLLFSAVTLVFFYFCLSSFWKAARVSRRRQQGRQR